MEEEEWEWEDDVEADEDEVMTVSLTCLKALVGEVRALLLLA